jgi:membrane-associated protein
VLDSLLELITGSRWTYALLFSVTAGDAVLPVLPSETALIVAGVLVELGRLDLTATIAAGAIGAALGDNVSYLLGRRVGRPATDRLFRSEKAQDRFRWAEDLLTRRGGQIILTARFLPGGRTAATFSAGLLHYRWLTRFLPLTLVAAAVWSATGVLLGYVGGRAVQASPWYALAMLVALAAVAAGGFELYRRLVQR